MAISIGCKELGIECDFVQQAETRENALESLMNHVKKEHAEDWFEEEEIYQSACMVVQSKTA